MAQVDTYHLYLSSDRHVACPWERQREEFLHCLNEGCMVETGPRPCGVRTGTKGTQPPDSVLTKTMARGRVGLKPSGRHPSDHWA